MSTDIAPITDVHQNLNADNIIVTCCVCKHTLSSSTLFKICYHPQLELPLCALCYNDHEKVLVRIEEDICFCCQSEDEDCLAVCWNQECKREYCFECLKMYLSVEDYANLESKDEWLCMVCDKRLVTHIVDAAKSCARASIYAEGYFELPYTNENVIEIEYLRLQMLHDGVLEAEREMTEVNTNMSMRQDIASELGKSINSIEVEEEVQLYVQSWMRQYDILQSQEFVCQDMLESAGFTDLMKLEEYRYEDDITPEVEQQLHNSISTVTARSIASSSRDSTNSTSNNSDVGAGDVQKDNFSYTEEFLASHDFPSPEASRELNAASVVDDIVQKYLQMKNSPTDSIPPNAYPAYFDFVVPKNVIFAYSWASILGNISDQEYLARNFNIPEYMQLLLPSARKNDLEVQHLFTDRPDIHPLVKKAIKNTSNKASLEKLLSMHDLPLDILEDEDLGDFDEILTNMKSAGNYRNDKTSLFNRLDILPRRKMNVDQDEMEACMRREDRSLESHRREGGGGGAVHLKQRSDVDDSLQLRSAVQHHDASPPSSRVQSTLNSSTGSSIQPQAPLSVITASSKIPVATGAIGATISSSASTVGSAQSGSPASLELYQPILCSVCGVHCGKRLRSAKSADRDLEATKCPSCRTGPTPSRQHVSSSSYPELSFTSTSAVLSPIPHSTPFINAPVIDSQSLSKSENKVVDLTLDDSDSDQGDEEEDSEQDEEDRAKKTARMIEILGISPETARLAYQQLQGCADLHVEKEQRLNDSHQDSTITGSTTAVKPMQTPLSTLITAGVNVPRTYSATTVNSALFPRKGLDKSSQQSLEKYLQRMAAAPTSEGAKASKANTAVKRPLSSLSTSQARINLHSEDNIVDDDVNMPPKKKLSLASSAPLIKMSKKRKPLQLSEATRKAERDELKRVKEKDRMHVFEESQDYTEGGFVINLARPDDDPELVVLPSIAKHLKDHQRSGIRFMFDNTIGSIKNLRERNERTGCVIAHCMGLGKTLSVVSYTTTLLTSSHIQCIKQSNGSSSIKSVLIMAPKNTLNNWKDEYTKWLPLEYKLLKSSKYIPVTVLADLKAQSSTRGGLKGLRLRALKKWHAQGGVLIISPQMFLRLVKKAKKPAPNSNGNAHSQPESHSQQESGRSSHELMREYLVNPGPDLVVVDEAHVIKDRSAQITGELSQIKTRLRIALTGSPIQNNLEEYYTMVSFVKPGTLGTLSEFTKRFIDPIKDGQHKDASQSEIRKMKQRSHVLHKLLRGIVDRKDVTVLEEELPAKREFVIKLSMTGFQRHLYKMFLDKLTEAATKPTTFRTFQVLLRVWNHPAAEIMQYLRGQNVTFTKGNLTLEGLKSQLAGTVAYFNSKKEAFINAADAAMKKLEPQEVDGSSAEQDEESDGDDLSSVMSAHNTEEEMTVANAMELCDEVNYDLDAVSEANSDDEREECMGAAKESSSTIATSVAAVADVLIDKEGKQVDEHVVIPPSLGAKKLAQKSSSSISFEEDDEKEEEVDAKTLVGRADWWRPLGADNVTESSTSSSSASATLSDRDFIELGNKITAALSLIALSVNQKEKMLVFSSSLHTLNLLELLLQGSWGDLVDIESNIPSLQFKNWILNKDYLRIDGSITNRQKLISTFESDDNCRLFLISTKAGNMGINLQKASRVLIFDVSWNPVHDLQAIFRAYRYGQKKTVFVYRFISAASMEETIYKRQIGKQALSNRVVDDQMPESHFTEEETRNLMVFDEKHPAAASTEDREKFIQSVVLGQNPDHVLAEFVRRKREIFASIEDHGSILKDVEEEHLNEEEQRMAQQEFDEDLMRERLQLQPPPNIMPANIAPVSLFVPPIPVTPSAAQITNPVSSSGPAI